jgi:hypothetical protein
MDCDFGKGDFGLKFCMMKCIRYGISLPLTIRNIRESTKEAPEPCCLFQLLLLTGPKDSNLLAPCMVVMNILLHHRETNQWGPFGCLMIYILV